MKRFPSRDNQLAHRLDSIQGTDYTANSHDYIVLLEFKGFEDKNWKSQTTTNQKKHLICNRHKICNIVVSEVVYKICKSRY